MSYTFDCTLATSFEDAIQQVRDALAVEGFGVLTEIDVKATMKKKLDKDLRPYIILGACHPASAWEAIQAEEKIGSMLPCNVIVQEHAPGRVEVSAIDPLESMKAVENAGLGAVAQSVHDKLQRVVASLSA